MSISNEWLDYSSFLIYPYGMYTHMPPIQIMYNWFFFSTKRKHKTNAWEFGLEKRVSSERPFSINHIRLHKEYKKDIWKDPQKSLDQLSSTAP